jgi:diguanylate cyclase (GGDEF)-like protein/PAS domain S-box-containing protein
VSVERRVAPAGEPGEAELRHVFDDSLIGLHISDVGGRFIWVNDAFGSMIGYSNEELVGMPQGRIAHPDEHQADADALLALLAGEICACTREKRYMHAAGHPIWASVGTTLIRDAQNESCYLIGHAIDVSERRRHEDRLNRASERDTLTGLASRSVLADVEAHRADGAGCSVALVDLEQMRAVNDTHGYSAGDTVLCTVATRLQAIVGIGDVLIRFGGDEFAVVVASSDPSVAEAIGRKAHQAIREPIRAGGVSVFVDSIVGLAVGDCEEPLSRVLSRADAAILHVKRGGGARRVVRFDPEEHADVLDTLALSIDLRAAVSREELLVHYQPIVDMVTRRPLGFEALVRWTHPERGMIPPSTFIPLAEQNGLMPELGAWVLQEACRQAQSWQRQFVDAPYVSINLSVRQLEDPDFADVFAGTLRAAGLAPELLTVEVTESVVATELDTVVAPLNAMRQQGVRVLLDDFGTGYSSLGSIRDLPLDGVKLDQVFTRDLTVSEDAWAIARAVVALLSKLGIVLIAEGIETASHLAQLRSLGCSVGQGYYFARPQVPDALRIDGFHRHAA